jgi:excisionase family DNA binding protein
MNKQSNGKLELSERALLTAKEFGELTGISEITVRRLCYSGEIQSRKIGRSLRIPISELK